MKDDQMELVIGNKNEVAGQKQVWTNSQTPHVMQIVPKKVTYLGNQ